MPGEPPGSSDPLDPAGLVGRAAEAAAIRRMLDGAPLVAVTGLPGVGKTAVSLAAARAAAAGSADGSLLLRLDRLRDEALLPHTFAAALRPVHLRTPAQRVRRAGRGAAAALTRPHASRPPLQNLYSLTDSMILNFTWWIRASW